VPSFFVFSSLRLGPAFCSHVFWSLIGLKGICVSEYALFGVAQIALERSRRRRGRRMPAPDAPTSRFAPPPPRALIPVSESCIFLYLIPFDSVICSGTGLLLSPSTVVSFYLTSKVTLYYSARRFVFFFLFLIPLKHFRFKDLQQLQVLISKGQVLVEIACGFEKLMSKNKGN